MAFSSQRTFLNVPFRHEDPKVPDRKRSDCQLKSYESCSDPRAWSMDAKVSAKFLLDVAHKARFPSKPSRPSEEGELTKEYLQFLSVEELIDYVKSLSEKLETARSQVRQLQTDRLNLNEQLISCEQEKEGLIGAQQPIDISSEQLDKEMDELKDMILAMKEKADQYDRLIEENKCMKAKLDRFCDETEDLRRGSFDEGACGDTMPLACERLKADLRIFKRRHDEIAAQKRTLLEQLQRSKVKEYKLLDLRRRLSEANYANESLQREKDSIQLECVNLTLELERKDEYINMCNRRLEKAAFDRRSSAPNDPRIVQRRSTRKTSRRSTFQEV